MADQHLMYEEGDKTRLGPFDINIVGQSRDEQRHSRHNHTEYSS